jgi:hypothetical protein
MKILFLLFLFTSTAYAQIYSQTVPLPSTPPPTCPVCPELKEERSSATNRDNSFGTIMGGFQFLNTWVPSKFTGSYTQIFNRSFSLELEYAGSERQLDIAGIDVGTLNEKRYSVMLKYYIGKSFHVSLGPYANDIAFELSDKVKARTGITSNDKVEVATYGIGLGLGNRWQFDNGFTMGIDWMRINQPTGKYKVKDRILKDVDDEDRQDLKRTGKLFRTFPAFTFFGVNIGYTF